MMYQSPDAQPCNTVETKPPAALIATTEGKPNAARHWKTIPGVVGHITERLIAAKAPPPPARSPEVEALIDRTARKYNAAYSKIYETAKADKSRQVPEMSEKKVIVRQNHADLYGYSGIDQATLDAFGGINLNLATMTREDRLKVYSHPLMKGEEKSLPLSAAVALLKVKLLDYRADLIDKQGPRPVKYGKIPAPPPPKRAEPAIKPDLSPRDIPTAKSLPRPQSAWTPPVDEPKKSFWQRAKEKAKSAVNFLTGARA